MTCAIVLAAGASSRMGADVNKVYLLSGKIPLLARTLAPFDQSPMIDRVIVVCRPDEGEDARRCASLALVSTAFDVVSGGETRQQSVANGMAVLPGDCDVVAVHDGARCLVSRAVIERCVLSAKEHGSGVAAISATDTLSLSVDGIVEGYVDRSRVAVIQTPQAFSRALLERAHALAREQGITGTDESSLVSMLGERVRLVEGDRLNIKVTTPEDYRFVRLLGESSGLRTGQGFDSHAICEGGRLVLGGVTIDCGFGLSGHSDADVLAHAVIDGVLGAAGLPDIGELFPDTDDRFKNADSMGLMRLVAGYVRSAGFEVVNVDSTVIMDRPKLSPYKMEMAANIAAALSVDESRVNVKAKTAEGMDNGCARALSAVLLQKA